MTVQPVPILSAEHVGVTFSLRGRPLHALDDVSAEITPGRTLAVVGESGSGKSTLARVLMRAQDVRHGRVIFDGTDVTALSGLLLGTTVLAPRSRHSPQRDRSGSAVTTTTAAPEAAIGSIRHSPPRPVARSMSTMTTPAPTRRMLLSSAIEVPWPEATGISRQS